MPDGTTLLIGRLTRRRAVIGRICLGQKYINKQRENDFGVYCEKDN